MILSELIQSLEALRAEHGDVEVFVFDRDDEQQQPDPQVRWYHPAIVLYGKQFFSTSEQPEPGKQNTKAVYL